MPAKTPLQTLIRVRNNQRRHRQRRREYIAYLEQKLEETEKVLSQAKADVAILKAELEKRALNGLTWTLQNASYPATPLLHGEQPTQLEQEPELILEEARKTSINAQHSIFASNAAFVTSTISKDILPPVPTTIHFNITDTSTLSIVSSPPQSSNSSTIHKEHPLDYFPAALRRSCCVPVDESPITFFSTPSPDMSQDLRFLLSACDNYPTSEMESTTLCSDACSLIAQQNHRGLNADTIRSWLDQGFRRARFQDEGCRVDNRLLFALLDFISGA